MFIFDRAIHTMQLSLYFVTFHIDKAACGTKDNIISEVSYDEGVFAAPGRIKREVLKKLSNSPGGSYALHIQILLF
jgi:hypothetical protein